MGSTVIPRECAIFRQYYLLFAQLSFETRSGGGRRGESFIIHAAHIVHVPYFADASRRAKNNFVHSIDDEWMFAGRRNRKSAFNNCNAILTTAFACKSRQAVKFCKKDFQLLGFCFIFSFFFCKEEIVPSNVQTITTV